MKLGRDFLLFRAGQFISLLGDAFSAIALPWWILEQTGSAGQMAAVMVPALTVKVVLLPLLGPLGDRFRRRDLAVAGDLWCGLVTLVLAAAAWSGHFSVGGVAVLYVFSSVGSALFMSVSASIVPQLVPPALVPEAVRQGQAISVAGTIVGSLLGGAVVAAAGVTGALCVDAASFFAAGLATYLIKADTTPARGAAAPGLAAWAADVADGVRIVVKVPVLLWTAVIAGALNFFYMPVGIALPYLVKEANGMQAWVLGAAQSAMSAGLLVGALLSGKLCRRFFPDHVVFGGIALLGAALAVSPHLAHPLALCAAFLAGGFGLMAGNIPVQARRALAVPDAYRSRVESFYSFLRLLAAPAGVWTMGAVITGWGVAAALTLCGCAICAVALLLYAVPRFSYFFRLPEEKVGSFIAENYPGAVGGL
ncbi:MAG TPA: hypothetical protein DCZ92_00075 [Elusimicrobia bacterium]|nr:MAG: hypothetical protein A2016_12635 [Elusimicrobia bacterium GWF2_62_30]HBA59223.1 hypothetical protein [Elusimicrobiota bacterium]